ncbi:NAD(P)-binding protein [Sistotremastrum suecicum HHB10207 ss-3]|uniref:NAD(P)-binding protein n=1 Tax=Sistotremastrum suecicum HHB10207 ss-3 TaxID=1314776 RepID=A0A166E6I4_9AGAM|nr:NAD(P)-binding protein [Sistotremastrum suecicum HHB10207 ss-3]
MSEIKLPSSYPSIANQVVIVTGGSSGIGLATVLLCIQNGARVVIADLCPPLPSNLPNSPLWSFTKTDVASWNELSQLFRTTYEQHNRIDILVANAGVGEVEDLFLDEFDESTGELQEPKHTVLSVNLLGVINSVKLAAHYFQKSGRCGKIVMTGSTAAYLNECLPGYQAAKHGLLGFMRAIRKTAPRFNVSINMVAPWMTMSALMTPELLTKVKAAGVPINEATSVAQAIVFLATCGWNGKTLFVAGNSCTEVEDALDSTRPLWLGSANDEAWKKAEKVQYFESRSGW